MRFLVVVLVLWAAPASVQTLSRLLVPLYSYPCPAGQSCGADDGFSFWSEVAAAARLCLETVAVINANSGPGTSIDPQYVVALDTMAQAGAGRIGYVSTQYGARSAGAIQDDIDAWQTFYGARIQGIFFDEVSAFADQAAFYDQLCRYARNRGFGLSVLNAGTQPEPGWSTTCDVVITFESDDTAWQSHTLRSDLRALGAYRLAAVVHTSSAGMMPSVFSEAQGLGYGYLYVTDDVLPNPYNNLPSYWGDEVQQFVQNTPQQTRYLAPAGSDAGNDCADAADPCLTIAHAASQASAGTILCLAAGTYIEPGLVIDQSLGIRGAGVVVR